MAGWRRLFDSRYRRARSADAAGRFRDAAALYAQAGAEADAAASLVRAAEAASSLADRAAAFADALRFAPDDDRARRGLAEARVALACAGGLSSGERQMRLRDAAQALEAAGEAVRAAEAWETVGEADRATRCLETAGEVDRLEALLARRAHLDARERGVLDAQRTAEAHVASGARREALATLASAQRRFPEARELRDAEERLRSRMPIHAGLRLRIEDAVVRVIGRSCVVVGREGDVIVRGGSVSRRHVELTLAGDAVAVRDLGSRNGTLVAGVPIGGRLELRGPVEVGLGEDAALRVDVASGGVLDIQVVRGLDLGARALASAGPIALPVGTLQLEALPILVPSPAGVMLSGVTCVAPIELLVGDVLETSTSRIEVLA